MEARLRNSIDDDNEDDQEDDDDEHEEEGEDDNDYDHDDLASSVNRPDRTLSAPGTDGSVKQVPAEVAATRHSLHGNCGTGTE